MKTKSKYFSGISVIFVFVFLLVLFLLPAAKAPVVIIIDAGHGGMDGGAVGISGSIEKELNLDIALKLCEIFEFEGYEVVMTRDTDRDTSGQDKFNKSADLKNRYEISKKYTNALFLSVHMNSTPSNDNKGFQVFYGHINENSKKLAESIYNHIGNADIVTRLREVKKSPESVYLMKQVALPAVLIECGFISNKSDETLLTNDEYRQKFALVLFEGIDEYIKNN